MPELKRFSGLRVRITLAMLLLAVVGSSMFAFSIFLAAERLEQAVLNRHIRAEFAQFAAQVTEDPGLESIRSALLLGFVGRDHSDLPAEFASLPVGDYHAVRVGDRAYQVFVGDASDARLYVAYDITEWEALEQPVIYILVAGVVLGCVLAIVLGFWLSAQIIAPVTALAARLRAIDPRERNVRVAGEFDDAEVSAIAESFDRYMDRLDGFVERERLFTSAAAHELRTPVAVMQGAADVLAEQPGSTAVAERATARLQRACRDMREFIDALLFLSREDPRFELADATCDVAEIVRQLVQDQERLVADRPVDLVMETIDSLRLEVPPALPTIVIGNLLRNAVEHTGSGRIRVSLVGRSVTITDTGSGIPPADLETVFARDYSTRPGGGMGLHLSKRICDRFGWELTVASGADQGTTARIRF